jgi:glutamate/tyrosine decarboxylase-like PLP-dependent enzyme
MHSRTVPSPTGLASIDWTPAQWRDAGDRVLELVTRVSTEWSGRRPSPDSWVGESFHGPLPEDGSGLHQLIDRLTNEIAPAASFNGHPRWFGYITSSPTPIGVLADFLAAALNQNVGLERIAPMATSVELQTIDWIKEMLGLNSAAEGVFLSGGQLANIAALAVMRDAMTPWDVRRFGAAGPAGLAPRLRIHLSVEAHYCHDQAAELLGLGREALRRVPVDADYRMRPDALESMVVEDRRNGYLPAGIVGTAGTVATGAVDPLRALAALARRYELWLHVDGSYGAFAALAADAPADLAALSMADSLACDPHKWLYAPIDAGIVIVNQPGLLERSFAVHASYLQSGSDRVEVNFFERSPENSRPFRALKVWLALQAYGRAGYADLITRNLALAAYLESRVQETPLLALAAPRELSIVCWRVEPPGMTDPDELNALQLGVIAELERQGVAIVSQAALSGGRSAIRACIVNFRTEQSDIDLLVEASASIGATLAGVSVSGLNP